ncbi:hypothetical protein K431DRAFT_312162 [Polychaeton citri CBS 116435]|uniref:Heterokaryon incompatibility domain-containing protein n=1 Tax=Polychaeton citri CBS 116435 TaxID=1314669 RepID=A0A9P4Q9C3_9PEZI|nr:hypothetical protein K431DRAFT_312162 [Polychaeton citri CBS 116435]
MLYPVPLDYSGDGSEIIDKQNGDQHSDRSPDGTGSEESPDYEAISYVWGEPAYSQSIELEGHGTLRITESLHSALERFRSTSIGRRLWADAICINQVDIAERSAQVAIMAKVYQQARRVLVWLGPAQESDALAFAAMPAMGVSSFLPDVWDLLKTLKSGCCPCCSESFPLVPNVAAVALLAIGRLLFRPWFSRLWVVQETCTTAHLRDHVTVFSGTHHISYADLRDSTQIVKSLQSQLGKPLFPEVPSDLIEQIKEMWSKPNPLSDWFSDIEEWPPSYLLRSLAGMSVRNCSDPLDRVYAVRSLLNLENIPSLLPDYKLAPAEVYESLVLALFDIFGRSERVNDQAWALLALAGTESSRSVQAGRSSWVPDFDALTSRSRSKIDLYTRIQWLELPQFLSAPRLFQTRPVGPGELQIRARCFAMIREILPDTEYPVVSEPDSDHISGVELTRFRDWHTRCLQYMNLPAEGESVISHSTTFLACACQLGNLPRVAMEQEEGAVDYSRGWMFPEQWPEDPDIVREHFMLLCATESSQPDKSRRIARIDSYGGQDHCWAPPQARHGDYICIVSGASFPFVVRRLPNGCYAMVGDTYLANTTLKQALGGGGKSRFDEDIYEEIDHPPTDDWNADDEIMQELIARMGWITLQ